MHIRPILLLLLSCLTMTAAAVPRKDPPPDSPPALPVREGADTIRLDERYLPSKVTAPSLTGRAGGESGFLTVDSRSGLAQNNVKSIAQDDFGFVWLGTKNGLCRYDGRSLRTVRVADGDTGAANQNISALEREAGHLLWVGTDQGLFLYDLSADRFLHVETAAADGQRMTNWVSEIWHDGEGNVWVVVPDEGIFRIACAGGGGAEAMATAPLHHYANPGQTSSNHFSCLSVGPGGEVWASGWNIGLWRYVPQTDGFEQLREDATGRPLVGIQTNTLTSLADGSLAMAVQDGHLLLYSPIRGELTENPWQDFSATIVRGARAYGETLLVGTYDGLYLINTRTGEAAHYSHDRNNRLSLSDDIIYSIFRDREGGYWLGTMFGGAAYLPAREQMFTVIQCDDVGRTLSSDRIRQLTTDGGTSLWLCTEDRGINHINLATGRITPDVGHTDSKDDNYTVCLTYFQGRLYAGINKVGVKVVDTRTGQTLLLSNSLLGMPEGASTYDISVDRQGLFWLATDKGVWRGRLDTGSALTSVEGLEDLWAYQLLHDRRGDVWAALMGGGLAHLDIRNGRVRRYLPEADNPHSLSSASVSAVFEDSRGRIWLSTDRGGICRYRPESDDFERFNTEQGLPDNVAYNILEDSHQRLWFGTNRGLVQLDPATGRIRLFTTAQGLPSNQFNYKAALALNGNTFFFGTINGLVRCHPDLLASDGEGGRTASAADLLITRLSIDGQEVTPQSPHSPLKHSIMETDRITLPFRHSNISLDIALLSYGDRLETAYEYRLEPLDEEWHPVPDGGLTLANVGSGTYTLRLRSSGLTGDNASQRERTLIIVVRQPLWRQWWAIVLYFIAAAALVSLWAIWYRRRKERQFQERQHVFAIEKEKELSEKRIQYFTEIAHEIRTPLTLISGPLEVIERAGIDNQRVAHNLSVIHQNTNRLLNLASQLLDFQKVDSGELHPQLETVNVSELLRDTMERFEPTYALRGKRLLQLHIEPAVLAQIDREAVTKILSNLLNNALKYGESRCEVELTSDRSNLRLAVFSDGPVIPMERREAIFDPFVQLRKRKPDTDEPTGGVGIGLALCRSLARMHNGTLVLETIAADGPALSQSKGADHPEGNRFVLTIPLGEAAITDDAPDAPARQTLPDAATLPEERLLTQSDVRGANILLVEDEDGLREFVSERLREDFIVETAANGQEALERIRATHIDLVVADIMMPVMDGIELCRTIKQDIELSHIPVIFLTAKNDTDSKIAGLQVGAEAYIEKPFAWDFLRMQIVSLLSNRQKEREAFAKRPFFPMNGMQMSREDEEFMERALAVINQHLSDESFNVEAMASALFMSRSSLLRKIKTLFDMPPLDFIRLIRLKKAADLIQDGRYRMGEISLKVGFSNHSYFSKLFCRQFGMTPKDFEKQIQEQRAKTKDLRQK